MEPTHPASHSWVWFRESQMAALELPHSGVASGPVLKRVEPKGDRLVVHIEYGQGLKTKDGQAAREVAPIMLPAKSLFC